MERVRRASDHAPAWRPGRRAAIVPVNRRRRTRASGVGFGGGVEPGAPGAGEARGEAGCCSTHSRILPRNLTLVIPVGSAPMTSLPATSTARATGRPPHSSAAVVVSRTWRRVAVMRSQSSGKYSIFEVLVGRDFLPRGSDIARAIPWCTSHAAPSTPRVTSEASSCTTLALRTEDAKKILSNDGACPICDQVLSKSHMKPIDINPSDEWTNMSMTEISPQILMKSAYKSVMFYIGQKDLEMQYKMNRIVGQCRQMYRGHKLLHV